MIVAGKVLGSHNLKGEVKVISDLDNIEVLVGNKVILELADSQQKLLTVKILIITVVKDLKIISSLNFTTIFKTNKCTKNAKYVEFETILTASFLFLKSSFIKKVKNETVIKNVPSEFLSKKSLILFPVFNKTYFVEIALIKNPIK